MVHRFAVRTCASPRLRQAARMARTALRREPVVRPDFLPRQSGVGRPLPGQKVGQFARYREIKKEYATIHF